MDEHLSRKEIVKGLWDHVQDVSNWLNNISRSESTELLAWCAKYLETTQQEILTVVQMEIPVADSVPGMFPEQPAPEQSVPEQAVKLLKPLTQITKQALMVLLALKQDEQPSSKREAARLAWPEEYGNGFDKNVVQKLGTRISGALKSVHRIKQGIENGSFVPEQDKDFYRALLVKYPDITGLQLDDLLEKYQAKPRRSRSSISQIATIDKVVMPKTDWLQLIWAMLFYTGEPSINKAELVRRTNLTDQHIEPMMVGALKSFDQVLAGEMEDPEPEFIQAVKDRFSGQTAAEILDSLRTGEEGELELRLSVEEDDAKGDDSDDVGSLTEEASEAGSG